MEQAYIRGYEEKDWQLCRTRQVSSGRCAGPTAVLADWEFRYPQPRRHILMLDVI